MTLNPEIDLHRWSERAPFPEPRSFYAAGVLGGALVVAGGTCWRDGKKIWSDRVHRFAAAANRWESWGTLPAPRGEGASVVCGESLYFLGGGAYGAVESSVLRFQAGVWSEVPGLRLPEPRRFVTAVVLGETIFFLGGLAATEFASAKATVWAARPDGRWKPRAPLPGPVRFNSAVAVVDGRILMAGGCTPEGSGVRNLDEIIAYDAAADRWTSAGRLPQPCRGGCGLEDRGRLLVIAGHSETFESAIFAFDPRSGRVEVVGALPHALCETLFFRVGSSIVGVSGEQAPYHRAPWTLQAGPTNE